MVNLIEHILLFLFSINAMFGFFVLTLSFLYFLQFRDRGWFLYSLLLFSIFLLYCTEILDIYGIITELPILSPSSALSIGLYRFLEQAIWILFPLFLWELFSKESHPFILTLLFLTSLIFPLGFFLRSIMRDTFLNSAIEAVFFVGISGWCLWGLFQVKQLQSAILQKIVWVLGGAILISVPFIWGEPQELLGIDKDISLPFFILYLLMNSLHLFYVRHFLFSDRQIKQIDRNLHSFCIMQGITHREEDIVHLILQGLTNKEIAFSLEITEKTVKNHIYSIYQKTGAQSRILLLLKIQASS